MAGSSDHALTYRLHTQDFFVTRPASPQALFFRQTDHVVESTDTDEPVAAISDRTGIAVDQKFPCDSQLHFHSAQGTAFCSHRGKADTDKKPCASLRYDDLLPEDR
jgi:hypothetical protein